MSGVADTAPGLEAWLSEAAGAPVRVLSQVRLSGGAIQQNVLMGVTRGGVSEQWVLRTDNAATLALSCGRAEEFVLLQAARVAGVTVAEPLFCCADARVTGAPFFIMRRVAGSATGYAIAKAAAARGGDAALAAAHGRELARIHRMVAPAFLGPAPADSLAGFITTMRARLDAAGTPRPPLEYGLRAMERFSPRPTPPVVCHNDFRTGNVMQQHGHITAVLDWEFCGWGDPHEDLGWFTAKCWRFGQVALEAGGIGPLDALLDGYAAEAGWRPDPARVRFWQLGATIRWAIIAADQAARYLSGHEPSLELALTGHMVPELEWDVLDQAEGLHGTA